MFLLQNLQMHHTVYAEVSTPYPLNIFEFWCGPSFDSQHWEQQNAQHCSTDIYITLNILTTCFGPQEIIREPNQSNSA
jgi:hypothetical protein